MDPYPLSDQQRAIAEAPWKQPALILAPPGTGKTHTVVARICHLVTQQGLQAHEVLVLSFTRAAVREISERLCGQIRDNDLHDNLRFVSLLTFDSFATRLMITADPDLELCKKGYNARIQMAIEQIRDPVSGEASIAGKIRHLIVDEIQDLVGHRAELVRTLLERIDGGFTLLGDPAQAIYGWALRDEGGGIDVDELLRWVRTWDWIPGLSESDLQFDYRSGGTIADRTSTIRERILAPGGDAEEVRDDLEQIIAGFESAGSAAEPGEALRNVSEGSLCILCRTNGELLQVASRLASEGLHYCLRPRSEDYALPPWIGRVLGLIKLPRISKQQFLEEWAQRIPEDYLPDQELAWRWLTRITGEDRGSLDLEKLRHELYRGRRLPDEADALLDAGSNGLMLSTIHASKGREFDRVVVLDPKRKKNQENEDHLEEARVLYVAATRSKDEILRLGRQGIPFMMKWNCRNGRKRWISASQSGYYYIEIGCNGDFDPCSPVSTYLYDQIELATRNQEYLWENVKSGDDVLILQERRGRYRFYRIFHGHTDESKGELISELSSEYFWDMFGALKGLSKGKRFGFPMSMKTLKVAALTTEVLPPYPENVHQPFKISRFCLGVRVKGMGYLWKK
jgi:hypothetical protein